MAVSLQWCARIIVLCWALFWTWFGLASGLGEGLDPLGVIVHTAVPGGLFLVVLAVAWRWEGAGGVLLLVLAAAISVTYPMLFRARPLGVVLGAVSMLAAPPLAAGVLFLLHRRHRKTAPVH